MSPYVLVGTWEIESTSFIALKEKEDEFFLKKVGIFCVSEEHKACKTVECVDTRFKNKVHFLWPNYKTHSSDALEVRNL